MPNAQRKTFMTQLALKKIGTVVIQKANPDSLEQQHSRVTTIDLPNCTKGKEKSITHFITGLPGRSRCMLITLHAVIIKVRDLH